MFDFKKIIYMPYYYVPKCPKCGSPVTGRYVRYHKIRKDDEDTILMSLRNGEIVDFLPEVIDKTAFCLSCGYQWDADIRCSFVNLSRIEEEKKKRGTNELLKMKMLQDEEGDKKKKFGIMLKK